MIQDAPGATKIVSNRARSDDPRDHFVTFGAADLKDDLERGSGCVIPDHNSFY